MWKLFVSSTEGGPTYQFNNSLDYTTDETGVRTYTATDGTFTLTTTSGGRVDPVPIPAAGWLLLSGAGGLFMAGRRRSARASAR